MDYTKAEFWISVVAIILSIISIGSNFIINKKINNINLNADLLFDTVKDYIKVKLPNAREKIVFSRKKLSGVESLQKVLNSFRKEILFLRYSDCHFFKKFKKYSQALEDYIVANEGKEFDSFEQEHVQKTITRKMIKIIKLVNKKYIG